MEDAADKYDLLIKEYPNSKYQLKAHLLGPPGEHAASTRARPTTTRRLREAAKLAKTTMTQFGNKLGDERERIAQAECADRGGEGQSRSDFARVLRVAARATAPPASTSTAWLTSSPAPRWPRKAKAELEKIRNEPDEPPAFFGSLFGGKTR